MKLKLKREDYSDTRTIGRLSIDGEDFCWTLEDRVRTGPKVHGQTAIPAGTYAVKLTMSPRFGCILPLLIDVPGFEGVRIHTGNTDKHTEGCLLVGTCRTDDAITGSREAFNALMARLEHAADIEIEVS